VVRNVNGRNIMVDTTEDNDNQMQSMSRTISLRGLGYVGTGVEFGRAVGAVEGVVRSDREENVTAVAAAARGKAKSKIVVDIDAAAARVRP